METLATNTCVFENKIFEPVKVASSAALYVDEYNRPNLRQLRAKNSVVPQAKCQPPPHGTLKINVDASCLANEKTSWGLITRDHSGSVLYAATRREDIQVSP